MWNFSVETILSVFGFFLVKKYLANLRNSSDSTQVSTCARNNAVYSIAYTVLSVGEMQPKRKKNLAQR
jgi:hypothetical protein